jgi:TrmH family RNA methyltransferase
MNKITSLQHPIVKRLVRLRKEREFRYEQKAVLVSGIKLIRELAPRLPLLSVLIEEGFELDFEVKTQNMYSVTAAMIKKISGVEQPEPILAEIEMPQEKDLSKTNFLLVLDGISDPGNLGTLLRTALGLGWDGVFLTPRCSDPFNDKAIRAARGATFTIALKSGNYEELKVLLRNKKVLAADAKGKDLSQMSVSPPIALVLGNEAHGIAPALKENAEVIAIPMQGKMESLNVASAGAILMYELYPNLGIK